MWTIRRRSYFKLILGNKLAVTEAVTQEYKRQDILGGFSKQSSSINDPYSREIVSWVKDEYEKPLDRSTNLKRYSGTQGEDHYRESKDKYW